MALKGHAKIELTDVKTGDKRVIEHGNMVTNGFLKLFNKRGMFTSPFESSNFFENKNTLHVKELFGGLYLFDGTLNNDADDYSIPSDVSCVGYASNVSNSSINNMLGSFNKTESGKQDDGSYRFVWDFATNQANGEIASLALTPWEVSLMGWNNKVGEEIRGVSIEHNFSLQSLNMRSYNEDCYLFYDDAYIYAIEKGNFVYNSSAPDNHYTTSKTLRIIKRRFHHKKVSVFGSYPYSTTTVETIEIEIPEMILNLVSSVTDKSRIYQHVEYDKGYIYMYVNSAEYIGASQNFYLLKINVEDWTASVVTVTNTINNQIRIGSRDKSGEHSWASTSQLRIVNGYVIVPSYTTSISDGHTGLYIIDLADNTNVKEVTRSDGTSIMASVTLRTGFKYKDYLFFSTGRDLSTNTIVVNIKTGDAFPIYNTSDRNCFCPNGASNSIYYFYNRVISSKDDEDSFHLTNYCCSSEYGTFVHLNPLILMTKNNLDESVVKTSAQTMKVIYTISEVLE